MSATYAPATATERRVSLSRGPALVVGTILLAAGLYFMYRQHTYPRWGNFPNGAAPVDLHIWGVFGVNGFTGLFTAICGGLLLFGAAEHYLSKTMSLIVGAALGAAAIIGVISGNVLGLAASNGWTELGWGIAAAVLLINALIPARRRTYTPAPARDRTVGAVGAGAAAGAAAGDIAARRRTSRVAEAEDPAYTGNGTAADSGAAAGAGTTTGAGATPAGTTTGAAAAPAEPGSVDPAEGRAPATAEPGAATTAAGAGTPAEAGAAAPAEPGAATTAAGAGTPAGSGRDVTYTHRITGDPEGSQQATEPVAAGRGNPPREDTTAGTRDSGGGAIGRLFGRRS